MSTDPRAGEEGGCEGASCWRRPFTVGLGVYERVVGEDGGAEGDRQGKRFFLFVFGAALPWHWRAQCPAYAYASG